MCLIFNQLHYIPKINLSSDHEEFHNFSSMLEEFPGLKKKKKKVAHHWAKALKAFFFLF